jgi:hypothetical protein
MMQVLSTGTQTKAIEELARGFKSLVDLPAHGPPRIFSRAE